MRNPRRAMCATILVLQGIVLALVTPVLLTVEDVSRSSGLMLGLGLATAALVLASMMRAEWAYYAGFVLQAASLALGFLVSVMFVLGLIFAALYATAYLLGRRIESDRAAWASQSH